MTLSDEQLVRKRKRDWYRKKYADDPEFAEAERRRRHDDLSDYEYSRKRLRDRRSSALRRMNARLNKED